MNKIKFSRDRYDFDDVDRLWECKGWGAIGHGETVKEAFEGWQLTLHLQSTPKWLAFKFWHFFLLTKRAMRQLT